MNIFTNDDYRRIQAWLKANAIKDSDFAISENTVPDEDILIITQNMSTVPTNYKIKIKDLLNSSLGKVVIDKITANVVKVNNILTVDASKVILNNEKGTTLQNVFDYFEDSKLNRHTDDTFDGNLEINKNLKVDNRLEIKGNAIVNGTTTIRSGNLTLGEASIVSTDGVVSVGGNFGAGEEISDGHNNILSDVNNAAKGWKIEYQDPQQDEPTVRAKYVLKDYKGVPKGNVIKVYKDSAITNVYLGTTDDTCNPDTGEVTKYPTHDNNETLSIVYRLDTGKYMLVNVPLGIFTREAEFDKYRGLGIEPNGQVFIKLASDVESTNYLHFNSLGEIAADGIEARLLRDLGTLIGSIADDGTMWGTYKEHEGTQEASTPNDGSRWGEFKRAEEIREQTSDSAHTVFADNWDKQDDDPNDYDPLAVTEASFAYNWKSTTNPNRIGNIEDLVNKVDALAVGVFYGYYPNESELPQDITKKGYAYIGTDNPYNIYNFDGTSWKDSGTTIQATSEADEEDITYNENDKLTFKDRNNTDGMGYVILRKNKSFAEQVTKENTIYEIRYEFDLNNEEIIIPENCVLNFNGGFISNGIVIANENCIIKNPILHNIKTIGDFIFDTIALNNINELKESDSLVNNMVVKTHGYYNIGDGGNAKYLIRNKTDNDIEDFGSLFELKNNLVAVLLPSNDCVNIRQFGCKAESDFDNSERLQNVINYSKETTKSIFIPEGNFLLRKSITLLSGTHIKGLYGYTFKHSCLYTDIQTDDYIMFVGPETDVIRHIIFEGVTLSRDRTNEERNAISVYNTPGYGYGKAGTCFSPITEANFIKCGFIGWGTVFSGGAIMFCNGTDFCYCNNVLKTVSNVNTFHITEANGWCLGNIIESTGISCQDININNSWFEYFESLIHGRMFRLINFSVDSSSFTNYAYGDNHPYIDISNNVWNTFYVNFNNSLLYVKDIISSDISTSNNKINIDNCIVYYRNYSSEKEKGIFSGSSIFYDTDGTGKEVLIKDSNHTGIDTTTSIAYDGITIPKINSLPTFDQEGNIKRVFNYLHWFDNYKNRQCVPPIYLTENTPKDSNEAELAGPYFIFNNAAHDMGQAVLTYKDNWGNKTVIARVNIRGTSANRPTNYTNSDKGTVFFDETLNKPIWWAGTKWVDATGADV